jgi:hypothetical protein
VKRATKRLQPRSTKKTVARTTKKPTAAAPVTQKWAASRTMTYALVGIGAVALLIGVPSLLQRSDSTVAAPESATSDAATMPRSTPPFHATKAAVKPAAVAKRSATPDLSSSRRPIETAQSLEVTPIAHGEPAAPTETRNAAAAVTISGCLQGGEDSFWLKDTDGVDAPKARSWKSGFLTKRSASIQVVDGVNGLNLSKYVGQRVTATGMLTNRTMQARSLHRVAASCN